MVFSEHRTDISDRHGKIVMYDKVLDMMAPQYIRMTVDDCTIEEPFTQMINE